MDDRPYYYRLRGRTLGPVGLRQIRQLVQRAQVGRTTEVSRDGQQWGKAADWPEIFDADGGSWTHSEATPVVAAAATPTASPAAGPAIPSSNWYYAVNGVQQGPVDVGALRGMIAAGQLTMNDHVFPEGGADWLPIGSVPQLAGAAGTAPVMGQGGPPVINITNPQPTPGSSSGSNGMAIAGFVLGILGLLLSCLCGLLSLPLWLLAIIFSGVALAGKNRSQRGLAIAGLVMGIAAAALSILMVILGIALNVANFNNFNF